MGAMPARVTPKQVDHYWNLRRQGFSKSRAAQEAGFSRTYAWGLERNLPSTNGLVLKQYAVGRSDDIPAPIPFEELGDKEKRYLDDFGLFRAEVLGHWSDPWQEESAEYVRRFLESAEKNYVVENMPPGAGKSTLFTHDIPAWLIARNRDIRILLGSRTMPQARRFVMRLKRTLERPVPEENAVTTMSLAFGRFKPDTPDLWRGDEMTVEQFGGVAVGEKEATVTAAAQKSGFLGGRYDLCIWDDLVDRKNTLTAEQREEIREWWRLEAETRLEPAGVLMLVGQRIGPEDLYRYALDMVDVIDEDDDEVDRDLAVTRGDHQRKYHHIVYKAHYEELCEGQHKRKEAKPYPDGCLLTPSRLSWRELATLKEGDPTRFAITMQQEDVDPEGQLVPEVWLTGGTGADGVAHPGCLDYDRNIRQLPEGLTGPLVSVVSVDPSPENWWSIQWWIYDCSTDLRYLMDHHRGRMRAPDLLDRLANNVYVGLAEDWQQASVALGYPITHWIVERAAAQRFMYQYDFWQKWISKNSVELLPHDTGLNKLDPDYGVQSIAPHYKYGRVRLPYAVGYGRTVSQKLTSELMKWPEGNTDDCVMANWFFEFHLQDLKQAFQQPVQRWTPSWLGRRSLTGVRR